MLKRIRVLKDPKQIKELMTLPEKYGLNIIKIGRGGDYQTQKAYELSGGKKNLSDYMLIEVKDTKLEITTRYYEYGKPTTYIFSLTEDELGNKSGHACFAELQRYYKIPKLTDEDIVNTWKDEYSGKYACTARPILDYNDKFEKQELRNCYEYDLNSAYFSTILNKIPDLYNPIKEFMKVKKGQVGFLLDDDLTMVNPGYYADVIFNLIDTPQGLKDFCTKYYNIKKTAAKGSQERKNAKDMLNLPIGYCQRWNPFFRSYVIHSCNKVIRDLIDDDTLFWNTDAIFSKKRRPELTIGAEIGQFKEEYIDKLRYIGNVYQINDDIPVYRGIPKKWFENFNTVNGRPFNLLLDKVPNAMNTWQFDFNTLKLEKINYEEID